MRRTSFQRSAFTLYHLIVLLVIVAMLMAFLFPLIRKVREAESRAQSMNNVKQIMLAANDYSFDQKDRLPPGMDDNFFSAHAQLLPYIEQKNVQAQIDFSKKVDDEANAQVKRFYIPTFVSNRDGRPIDKGAAPNNYFFNAGTKADLKNNNGPFYWNSKVTLTQITNQDGTANTIGVVESLTGDGGKKAFDIRRQHVLLKPEALKDLDAEAGVKDFMNSTNIVGTRGSNWMDGRFLQGTINAGRRINDMRPDVSCGGLGGWGGPRTLDGYAIVGLCDGSARSVSMKVSRTTWQRAMSYNDGLPVGGDF